MESSEGVRDWPAGKALALSGIKKKTLSMAQDF